MLVLAIDCALDACSAAVLDSAAGAIVASQSRIMARGHAEAVMPLVARVMDEAAVEFSALGRVAVTVGPGSFTGLRVGIAAARGLALAAEKPAVGLSTLSAYAAPHIANVERFPVVAAVDARHNHVYLQVFAPGGRLFTAPRLTPLRDAVKAAAGTSSFITGSAARLVASALSADDPVPVGVDASAAPNIAWVARMGAVVPEDQAPLKPQYLRIPDAQPQNASQLSRR